MGGRHPQYVRLVQQQAQRNNRRRPSRWGEVNFNIQWFDTLTARIGYSFAAPWLFYFQGGGAWSHTSTDAHDRNIVTAGAPCPPPGCFFNTKATGATVLVGVNYRFW